MDFDASYIKDISTQTGLAEAQIAQILQTMIQREQLRYMNATTIAEMQVVNMGNLFSGTVNAADMLRIQQLIEKIASISVSFEGVAPDVMRGMAQTISDSSRQYFTRYGDDIKTGINKVLQDGINKGLSHNQIANQIDDIFKQQLGDGKMIKGRGMMIARTEVMRASNLGSYWSARMNGATHFRVMSRKTRCSKCGALYQDGGKIFTIDQLNNLPPLHPRCRCIPMFFSSLNEAKAFKPRSV